MHLKGGFMATNTIEDVLQIIKDAGERKQVEGEILSLAAELASQKLADEKAASQKPVLNGGW